MPSGSWPMSEENRRAAIARVTSPEVRAKARAVEAALYADPDWRAQFGAKMSLTWRDPAMRARRIAGLKRAWARRKTGPEARP